MQDASFSFQSLKQHQIPKLNVLERYLLTKNKIHRKTWNDCNEDGSICCEQKQSFKRQITTDHIFSKRKKYLSGQVGGAEIHPSDSWNKLLQKMNHFDKQKNNQPLVNRLLEDIINKNKKDNCCFDKKSIETDQMKNVNEKKQNYMKYNIFRARDENEQSVSKLKNKKKGNFTILKLVDLQKAINNSKRKHKISELRSKLGKQNNSQSNRTTEVEGIQNIQKQSDTGCSIKNNNIKAEHLFMNSVNLTDRLNFQENYLHSSNNKYRYAKKWLNTAQITIESINLDQIKLKRQKYNIHKHHNRSDMLSRIKLAEVINCAPIRKTDYEEIKVEPWSTFQKIGEQKGEILLQRYQ